LATGAPSPRWNRTRAPPPTLFGELRPACFSSSIGSCLMTAYPPRCRRISPEPPPATTRLLRRRAPTSRPTSATSTPPRRVGKPPTGKPCPAGRSCAASAPRVNTAPPSLPPRRRWLRHRRRAGHSDCARRVHPRRSWQAVAPPQAATRARLGRPRSSHPWAAARGRPPRLMGHMSWAEGRPSEPWPAGESRPNSQIPF
jgi:hypothetical protein